MSANEAERATRIDRIVGVVLAAGLAAVAAVQMFWTLGGTWGVHAASGGAYEEVTTALRVQSAFAAVLFAVGCLVALARVGLWTAPVSFRVVRIGAWVLTVALWLGAVVNVAAPTNWERFGNGSVALVLAILALVVAGAGREHRVRLPRALHPSH